MKISQKKTCIGCRALTENPNMIHFSSVGCVLHYHNSDSDDSEDIKYGDIIPRDPCPKPKTYKELDIATSQLKKQLN